MKTPREILFERHKSAEPKLDAVRQETVAAVCSNAGDEVTSLITKEKVRDSLRRLLLSLRWHFAAMSAIWLLALFLNADHSQSSTVSIATINVPSPQKILVSLRENRRLLLQMIELPANEPVAAPPRRSQIQFLKALV